MSVLDRPEVKKILQLFEREVIPNIKASTITVAINGKPDAKLCLEIGAAVLLDKPLILCVPRGTFVPPKLRTLATRIVEIDADMSDASKELVTQAINEVLAAVKRRVN